MHKRWLTLSSDMWTPFRYIYLRWKGLENLIWIYFVSIMYEYIFSLSTRPTLGPWSINTVSHYRLLSFHDTLIVPRDEVHASEARSVSTLALPYGPGVLPMRHAAVGSSPPQTGFLSTRTWEGLPATCGCSWFPLSTAGFPPNNMLAVV